jgi:hypothetical protein
MPLGLLENRLHRGDDGTSKPEADDAYRKMVRRREIRSYFMRLLLVAVGTRPGSPASGKYD